MVFRGLRPSTAGEKLYLYIAEQVLGARCSSEIAETQLLRFGGRTVDLSEYFFGFACSSIFTRLLKKAERVIESESSAPDRTLARYIQRTLEIGLEGDRSVATRMASLAATAVSSSHRTIPPSVIKAVNGERQRLTCFLCGNPVQRGALDEGAKLEYEHIWPSSYGGDSIAENLLPACGKCNRAKSDLILWHTGHVAGFCLKPQPSENEMTRVERKHKIARYMRSVFDLASENRSTLKDAALSLGPIDMSTQKSIDPDDARDFFNLCFN